MKSVQNLDTIFCLDLIGRGWKSGADGPKQFDCWGLLRYAYKERRGILLPFFPGIETMGALRVVKEIEKETQTTWKKVKEPEHFCAVGISSGRLIHHVGIWLQVDDGGVLHSTEQSGVVFQNRISMRGSGMPNLTFYKLQEP
jgi:cell wall-associated NlpC family hydrolase